MRDAGALGARCAAPHWDPNLHVINIEHNRLVYIQLEPGKAMSASARLWEWTNPIPPIFSVFVPSIDMVYQSSNNCSISAHRVARHTQNTNDLQFFVFLNNPRFHSISLAQFVLCIHFDLLTYRHSLCARSEHVECAVSGGRSVARMCVLLEI